MGIIGCPAGRAVLHARIRDGAVHPRSLPTSALVRPKQSHTLLWVLRFKKDEVEKSPEGTDGTGAPGNIG